MRLTLDYVKGAPGEGWRYRRAVPQRLRAIIGLREWKRFLGHSKAEAVRNYGPFHTSVERQLREAVRQLTSGSRSIPQSADTPLAQYHAVRDEIQALGFDPDAGRCDSQRDEGRQNYADGLLDSYPLEDRADHPDYGSPLLPEPKAVLARALYNGLDPSPSPTLADAARVYLSEKVKTDGHEDKKKRQRIDRVLAHALTALGGDRRIASMTPADGLLVRDRLAKPGSAPATVTRYLNDLRGMTAYALRMAGLERTVQNPFAKLPSVETKAQRALSRRDGRKDVPVAELEDAVAAVGLRLHRHASVELHCIWLMLEYTGCRVSEVTSLRKTDVVRDGSPGSPYIATPPVKGSARDVPLLPVALEAAEKALGHAGDSEFLFPTYSGELGATNASKALMKHVRVVTKNTKIVNHSLRHRLVARMMANDVEEGLREYVEGRNLEAVRKRYGTREVVRSMMAGAIARAFPGPGDPPTSPVFMRLYHRG